MGGMGMGGGVGGGATGAACVILLKNVQKHSLQSSRRREHTSMPEPPVCRWSEPGGNDYSAASHFAPAQPFKCQFVWSGGLLLFCFLGGWGGVGNK